MLLFVLRDKTRTPLPRLVETLETDLAKMWDTIRKPAQYKDSLLTDFFEVGCGWVVRWLGCWVLDITCNSAEYKDSQLTNFFKVGWLFGVVWLGLCGWGCWLLVGPVVGCIVFVVGPDAHPGLCGCGCWPTGVGHNPRSIIRPGSSPRFIRIRLYGAALTGC